MDILITQRPNGKTYISLTDLVKCYKEETGLSYNLSQTLKNFPDEYKVISRGRNAESLLELSVLPLFLNARKNLPHDFINRVLNYTKQKASKFSTSPSLESFFIGILESFLTEMIPNLDVKRQYNVGTYYFDFAIGEKILIEYDESHHLQQIDSDQLKEHFALGKGYKVIRVLSTDSYGKSIAKIYRLIKTEIL